MDRDGNGISTMRKRSKRYRADTEKINAEAVTVDEAVTTLKKLGSTRC